MKPEPPFNKAGPDPIKVICLGDAHLKEEVSKAIATSHSDVVLVDTPDEAEMSICSEEACEMVLRDHTQSKDFVLTYQGFPEETTLHPPNRWTKPYPPPKGRRGHRKYI